MEYNYEVDAKAFAYELIERLFGDEKPVIEIIEGRIDSIDYISADSGLFDYLQLGSDSYENIAKRIKDIVKQIQDLATERVKNEFPQSGKLRVSFDGFDLIHQAEIVRIG